MARPVSQIKTRWPNTRPGPLPVLDETWMERGACTPQVAGPDWDPARHYDRSRVEEAKAMCFSCDVIADCLRFARMTKQSGGVWGAQVFEKVSVDRVDGQVAL